MAQKEMFVHLSMNDQQLIRSSFEKLATAPVTNLTNGRMYFDTTIGRVGWYDAVATEWHYTVHLEDLEQFSAYVGSADLSGNTVPTTGSGPSGNVRAGDRWIVSVGTTGAGLTAIASGSPIVSPGDMLVAIADRAAGTATQADFAAINTNIDLSAGLVKPENLVIASIPAGVPTDIGSALTTIYSAQFFDASGIEIGLYFDAVDQEVTSNVALTNVSARVLGVE